MTLADEGAAVTPPRWMEYLPLRELQPDPRNPKGHSIDQLRASMGRFAYTEAIMLDERTGLLIAGHGRRSVLIDDNDAGRTPPEGVIVADNGTWLVPVQRGWHSADDSEAYAYLIAANQLTIAGGWDDAKLAAGLREMAALGDEGLAGIGFDADDLAARLAAADESTNDNGTAISDGSLLSLADVSFGEPAHKVHDGDVYRIVNDHAAHWLVVADVMAGWPLWAPHLEEGCLFVPYPGPYAALSRKADMMTLVLVQPDHFLAGHLLDKYEAVKPGRIEHVTVGEPKG